MEECVLIVAYVDEGGIQTRHQFLDLGQVDVANGVSDVGCFFLQRHEPSLLKQGYGDFLGLDIDYKFASHWQL